MPTTPEGPQAHVIISRPQPLQALPREAHGAALLSPATKPKPLVSADSHPCLLAEESLRAMLQALTGPLFAITEDEDAGTVQVVHTASDRIVLVALAKGSRGPWITRHHRHLFD